MIHSELMILPDIKKMKRLSPIKACSNLLNATLEDPLSCLFN